MHSKSGDVSVRSVVGDRERVRTVSKLALGTVSTVVVLYAATLLPGLDRLHPRASDAALAGASAVATLAVVASLYYLASGLAALVRAFARGPADLVENAASAVYWSVVLVAVLVAHRGLEPAADLVVDDATRVYDGAFLLAALAPLSFVAALLYVSLDPAADLIAGRVARDPAPATDGSGGVERDPDEVVEEDPDGTAEDEPARDDPSTDDATDDVADDRNVADDADVTDDAVDDR